MHKLIVSDMTIRSDAFGRYCLNDLHKVAGGLDKHRPSKWVGNLQTQELAQEISRAEISALEQNQPLNVVNGGVSQGTYACIELVYAYATWINPVFHLRVIRAYHAMVTAPQVAKHKIPQTLHEALRLAADLSEQKALLEGRLAIAATKAEALDRISEAEGAMTITDAAKALQLGPMQLFGLLREWKWIYRRVGGGDVAYQDKISSGLLVHKVTQINYGGAIKVDHRPIVTARGLAKLSAILGYENRQRSFL